MGREWPLRGRDREHRVIREGLAAGRPQIVRGAAGVGKTRLVSDVVGLLAGSGTNVTRLTGAAAVVSLPFAPFLSLLPPENGTPSVPSILTALGAERADRNAPDSLPVVQIDDAHLLDDSSASLLYQLAIDGRVRLILTLRSGEQVPLAITSLSHDAEVDRILLDPLNADVATDLLAAALGGPLDGATARRIVASAGGNPLWLRELTEGAIDSGILVERAGLWTLTHQLVVDPAIHELVSARLGPLEQPSRDVLELLALAGHLRLDELAELDLLDQLETLERLGLVEVRDTFDGTTIECGHPIHAEVLLAQLPRVARLRHCRRLADLLEHHGRDDADTWTRATMWRFEAGEHLDADRLLEAADHLRIAGDLAGAARLATASCDRGATPESVILASWSLSTSGDQATALDVLRRHGDISGSEREIAGLALREAEQLWWANGAVESARAVLASARERLNGSTWVDLLDAQEAVFDYLSGDIAGIEERVAWLLDHEQPGVRTTAALALEMSWCEAGRPGDGLELACRALDDALANPIRFIGDPGIHLVAQTACHHAAGDLRLAGQLSELLYQLAVALPAPHPRGWASLGRGQLRLDQGQFDDAIADLTEAELIWSDLGMPGMARWAGARVVIAAASRGDVLLTTAALERLAGYRPDGFELQEVVVARAGAWAHSVLDPSTAPHQLASIPTLPRALRSAVTAGRWTEVSIAAVDLIRLGQPADAVDLMAMVPTSLDPVVERRRKLVDVGASGDGAACERAATALADEGRPHLAAEWLTLAAAAFDKDGDTEGADRTRIAARHAMARCQGLATPLVRATLQRGALSRREQEIAELASRGWSNRRIASHLVLSERTVENHLYRAFAKLRITSREQLADSLAVPA